MYNKGTPTGVAVALAGIILSAGLARADTFAVTRANLAKNAIFTVTQTLAPKGGTKFVRVFKIEVKGEKARVDFADPNAGDMRYIANDKGLFIYIPGNKTAMKQSVKGGVESALKQAFAQANSGLAGAKKVGTAIVSGQPTDVYRDPKKGSVVYMGTANGFRLPVKVEQTNVGGTTTLVVTGIRLNPVLADTEFVLPTGTHVEGSEEGGAELPGAR